MKRYALILAALLPLTSATANAAWFTEDEKPADCVNASGASYETAFAPDESATALVIKTISSAKKSIRVVTRTFVSKPVSEALISAGRAGKDVKVVVDKDSNSNGYTSALFMQTMGNAPRLSGMPLHMSFMVIDDHDVVLGGIASLPEIEDEKKKAVAVMVIHNTPDLAKRYLDIWQKTWAGATEMPVK